VIWKDRLDLVVREHNTGCIGDLATTSEVLAWLHTTQPRHILTADWQAVHTWAETQTAARSHPSQAEAPPLAEPLVELYQELARFIRERVLKHGRKQEKTTGLRRAIPSQPCPPMVAAIEQLVAKGKVTVAAAYPSFKELARRRRNLF
jgi:hypothetical protein